MYGLVGNLVQNDEVSECDDQKNDYLRQYREKHLREHTSSLERAAPYLLWIIPAWEYFRSGEVNWLLVVAAGFTCLFILALHYFKMWEVKINETYFYFFQGNMHQIQKMLNYLEEEDRQDMSDLIDEYKDSSVRITEIYVNGKPKEVLSVYWSKLGQEPDWVFSAPVRKLLEEIKKPKTSSLQSRRQ